MGAAPAAPADARHAWFRVTQPLGEDPALHQHALAYLSDHGPTRSAREPHAHLADDARRQSVSLDHSVWFHRPCDVNGWLLSELVPVATAHGRGLAVGTLRTLDGTLVATVAQEVLLRTRWAGPGRSGGARPDGPGVGDTDRRLLEPWPPSSPCAGLRKSFGPHPGARRSRPRGRRRRGARLPRARTAPARPTTMRILLGLLRADAARSGCSAATPGRRVRAAPPPGLRARRHEPVAQADRRRGHRPARPAARRPRPQPAGRAHRALRPRPHARRPAAYSKGNRQKVALVAALASDAELLMLDEPTAGLDPLMEAVFQDVLLEAERRGPHRAAVEPHPRPRWSGCATG